MNRALTLIGGILTLALIGGAPAAGRGAAEVEHPLVSVTSAAGPSGGQVTVSLDGETGGATIGAFIIDLVYDPAVVTAVECTSVAGLCNEAFTGSSVRVAGISLGGMTGHIDFADITFDVTGSPGSSTGLDIQLIDLFGLMSEDYTGQANVQDGEVSVTGGGPTPTPDPALVDKGDADCSGGIDSVDALMILKDVAGVDEAGCGEAADVDCDGDLTAADSLGVLRYVVSLPFNPPAGCTPIGEGG